MKKNFFYSLLAFFLINNKALAVWDGWFLWVSETKIKNWDFTLSDIPNIISNATWFFMWLAWTVAVLVIIVWAYKYLFWSLQGKPDIWRETIAAAVFGFILAASAYIIIKFIIDNFS